MLNLAVLLGLTVYVAGSQKRRVPLHLDGHTHIFPLGDFLIGFLVRPLCLVRTSRTPFPVSVKKYTALAVSDAIRSIGHPWPKIARVQKM
ncbi:hypothetical protein BJ170DRAFT_640635, partial [Xylariales sp. AK1849]